MIDAAPSRPIFVVGAPRSGTTLLRYMLCSHPRIYLPPESNFLPRFFRRRPRTAMRREDAVRVLEVISTYEPFWRDWTGPPPDPETLLAGIEPITPAALLDALYARYAAAHGAERWGDKSPNYASHIGLIDTMFPDAQIVHVVRDGRDVAASSLEAYRGARFFYVDPYYAGRNWQMLVGRAMRQGLRLGPDRYLQVRYEDLTADPPGQLRSLCAFLGEQYDPAMAVPSREASLHHHKEGIHRRVLEPVTTASTGAWRSRVPPRDQPVVQRAAGPLLPALGYELADFGRSGPAGQVRFAALAAKYATTTGVRRALRAVGLFHPTSLLEVRRGAHGRVGAGRAASAPDTVDTAEVVDR